MNVCTNKTYLHYTTTKHAFFFPVPLHYMSFTTKAMLKLLKSTFAILRSELTSGVMVVMWDKNLLGNALENVFTKVIERSLLRIVK